MKRVDRLNKHGEKAPGLPEKTKGDATRRCASQAASGPGGGKNQSFRLIV